MVPAIGVWRPAGRELGSPFLDDVPVVSDYDGEGKVDVAVYRRTTGEWFVRGSSDGRLSSVPWGTPTLGDGPVPGTR